MGDTRGSIADNFGRRKSYSTQDLYKLYPRVPGESQIAYQARIGKIQWNNANNGPPTPDLADAKTPQSPFESNLQYGVRSKFVAPLAGAAANFGKYVGGLTDWMADKTSAIPGAIWQAASFANDTPNAGVNRAREAAAAKAPKPANVFASQGQPMNSWKDPRWGDFEAQAEAKYGLPSGTLASIRTKGERSNGDQVSSAGARGVYQFTQATRDAVQKKYGVDAYGSPAQQAMAAAALLKENMDRTGSIQGAVQQYHGGTDPSNYGPQNAAYMSRVFGGQGAPGFVNPFDPSYYGQAAEQLDKAGAAAKAPTTFTYTPEGAPQMPDAAEFVPPPTDFSKVDAAIQKLKPVEITEAMKLQTRRSEWFRGIGQALASLPEGAGLGKVLATVGGGALMGGAAGDDRVKRDMEVFDAKMAQYNTAVLNNEQNQAQVRHAEAAQKAQMLYGAAMKKYDRQYDEWSKYNSAGFDAQGNLLVSKRDPQTGAVTMSRVPNAAAIDAATARGKADLFMHAGDQQNAGNRLVATAENGLIANTIAMHMASGQADDQTVLAMPAFIAGTVFDGGGVDDLIRYNWKKAGQPQMAESAIQNLKQVARQAALSKLGNTTAGAGGIAGLDAATKLETSKEYQEAYRAATIQYLQRLALERPQFRKDLFEFGGVFAAGQKGMAMGQAKTTTRTGPKGSTTSTTVDMGDY